MSGIVLETRLADLRRLLAEKFPVTEHRPGGILRTGLADVDAPEGGLRRAALTELTSSTGSGAVFIQAMLRAVQQERCFAALVDAARTFEPESCPAASLARLLIVFCADAMQAVQATDLLLRDGNLSLILLDFQAVPSAQLRRIPANTWYRFHQLAEQTTAAVVVLTTEPTVEAAQVRIAGVGGWTLAAQRGWRHELMTGSKWRVFPRRIASWSAPARECAHATA
jgi:hypothetical protein